MPASAISNFVGNRCKLQLLVQTLVVEAVWGKLAPNTQVHAESFVSAGRTSQCFSCLSHAATRHRGSPGRLLQMHSL